MKRIAILVNVLKKDSNDILNRIVNLGDSFGAHVFEINVNSTDVMADAIISIGGDGTFLEAARIAVPLDIPVIGINLGTLGFLTRIDKEDFESAIKALIFGDYAIIERSVLELTVVKDDKPVEKNFAINDVCVARAPLSRILHLGIYINSVFTYSFPGDGLVISTPMGSTAYSLSAGGPIVDPDLDVLNITPICAHMFHAKAVVTSGEKVIKVEVDKRYDCEAMVTVDGKDGYSIDANEFIEIKNSNKKLKMIMISEFNFYSVLKEKFFKREDGYNKNENSKA